MRVQRARVRHGVRAVRRGRRLRPLPGRPREPLPRAPPRDDARAVRRARSRCSSRTPPPPPTSRASGATPSSPRPSTRSRTGRRTPRSRRSSSARRAISPASRRGGASHEVLGRRRRPRRRALRAHRRRRPARAPPPPPRGFGALDDPALDPAALDLAFALPQPPPPPRAAPSALAGRPESQRSNSQSQSTAAPAVAFLSLGSADNHHPRPSLDGPGGVTSRAYRESLPGLAPPGLLAPSGLALPQPPAPPPPSLGRPSRSRSRSPDASEIAGARLIHLLAELLRVDAGDRGFLPTAFARARGEGPTADPTTTRATSRRARSEPPLRGRRRRRGTPAAVFRLRPRERLAVAGRLRPRAASAPPRGRGSPERARRSGPRGGRRRRRISFVRVKRGFRRRSARNSAAGVGFGARLYVPPTPRLGRLLGARARDRGRVRGRRDFARVRVGPGGVRGRAGRDPGGGERERDRRTLPGRRRRARRPRSASRRLGRVAARAASVRRVIGPSAETRRSAYACLEALAETGPVQSRGGGGRRSARGRAGVLKPGKVSPIATTFSQVEPAPPARSGRARSRPTRLSHPDLARNATTRSAPRASA